MRIVLDLDDGLERENVFEMSKEVSGIEKVNGCDDEGKGNDGKVEKLSPIPLCQYRLAMESRQIAYLYLCPSSGSHRLGEEAEGIYSFSFRNLLFLLLLYYCSDLLSCRDPCCSHFGHHRIHLFGSEEVVVHSSLHLDHRNSTVVVPSVELHGNLYLLLVCHSLVRNRLVVGSSSFRFEK